MGVKLSDNSGTVLSIKIENLESAPMTIRYKKNDL